MEIRQAILKAADSIEQHPELFNFHTTRMPDCDTPSCALGWIALHAGKNEFRGYRDVLNVRSGKEFYLRMRDLHGGFGWRHTAVDCANALRLYADKYHPKSAIPDYVLAIFDEKVAA